MTPVGWSPQWLETNDAPTLYFMKLQTRLILMLCAQVRNMSNITMTCIFADKDSTPFKQVIACQDDFRACLAEARSKQQPNDKAPPIGAPHIQLMMTFLEELVEVDCGAIHKDLSTTLV